MASGTQKCPKKFVPIHTVFKETAPKGRSGPKKPLLTPPTGPKTTLRTSKMGPKTTLRTSKMGPKTTFGTLKTGLLGPGGLRRLVWYSGVRIGGAEAGYLQSSFLDLVSVPKLKIIFYGHNLKKFANSPHLEGGEFRPSARGVQGTRSRPPGTPPPQTGVARRVAQQQNKGLGHNEAPCDRNSMVIIAIPKDTTELIIALQLMIVFFAVNQQHHNTALQ